MIKEKKRTAAKRLLFLFGGGNAGIEKLSGAFRAHGAKWRSTAFESVAKASSNNFVRHIIRIHTSRY